MPIKKNKLSNTEIQLIAFYVMRLYKNDFFIKFDKSSIV